MVELRGLKVWIESEGKVLEEYGVERTAEDGEHIVSSFIISDVGKKFTVTCENPLNDLMVLDVKMDGTCTELLFCDPGCSRVARGVNIAERLYKPYQFSVLKVIDEPPDSRTRDSLGVIEVNLYRVKRNGKPCASTFSALELNNDPVPEKSKKLAAHRITLGEAQEMKAASNKVQPVLWIDNLAHPFASFQFRYRPKDLLQAQGIIPAAPSASSSALRSRTGSKKENEGGKKRKRSAKSASEAGGPSKQSRRVEGSIPEADRAQSSSDDDLDVPLPFLKTEDLELDEEGPAQDAAVSHRAQLRMMKRRLKALEARARRDRRTIQELRVLQQEPETIDLTED